MLHICKIAALCTLNHLTSRHVAVVQARERLLQTGAEQDVLDVLAYAVQHAHIAIVKPVIKIFANIAAADCNHTTVGLKYAATCYVHRYM